jgi:hypothetical protein
VTRRRIVHRDRDTPTGVSETFPSMFTVCAPQGSRTAADWDRVYLSTTDAALVTCSKCRNGMLTA